MIRNLSDTEQKTWSRAIYKLCSSSWMPALRSAFAHLMPFIDDSMPTAYTDCKYRVGLSPILFDESKTTIEQLCVIILHETMHNIQKHNMLIENHGFNGMVVNFATDLEINSVIAQGVLGINLYAPIDPHTNGHWDYLFGNLTCNNSTWEYDGILIPRVGEFKAFPPNLTAEQYLQMLDRKEETIPMKDYMQQARNPSESNNNNTSHDTSSPSNTSPTDNETNPSSSSSEGTPTDSSLFADDCGDGFVKITHIYAKDENGNPIEIGKKVIIDRIDVNDDDTWNHVSGIGIDPISRFEEEKVKNQLRHDIDEYHKSSNFGYSKGGMILDYVLSGMKPPRVNWKRAFRLITASKCREQSKGHDDYTYRRTSRRYSQGRFISPGLISYIPKARVALDTSGSMSQEEYDKAFNEINGILRTMKTTVEFQCADTTTYDTIKAKNIKSILNNNNSPLQGGGGTDMSAPIRYLDEEKPTERPDVLIIATDGIFDWERLTKTIAESQSARNVSIIMLLLYDFTEEHYQEVEESINHAYSAIRQYHKDFHILNAWL